MSILLENAANPELSFKFALLVGKLHDVNAEVDIRRDAESIESGVQEVIFVPATDLNVAYAWIKWPGVSAMILGGCSKAAHGTQYVDAISPPINYSIADGANPWLVQVATYQVEYSISNRILPNSRIIVAGHSMGGATAFVIARLLMQRYPNFAISVITYGAPRPGPSALAHTLSNIDICRWMNVEDPVPMVPPRPPQAPLAHATLTPAVSTNWNRYIHTQGGLLLEEGGGALSRDVPEIPVTSVQTSLALWLYSCWLGQESLHSMPTYLNRLGQRMRRFPTQVATPRPTTHSESGGHYEREADQRHAIKEIENALRAAATSQDRSALNIPREWQFRAENIGGVWCLVWQDAVVSIGPGRRKVRDQARAANTFLRRLQRSAAVGTDVVPIDFKAYLEAATDQNGGFLPVMRKTT